jgi:hypothetical protein
LFLFLSWASLSWAAVVAMARAIPAPVTQSAVPLEKTAVRGGMTPVTTVHSTLALAVGLQARTMAALAKQAQAAQVTAALAKQARVAQVTAALAKMEVRGRPPTAVLGKAATQEQLTAVRMLHPVRPKKLKPAIPGPKQLRGLACALPVPRPVWRMARASALAWAKWCQQRKKIAQLRGMTIVTVR